MNSMYELPGVIDALVRIGDAGGWPDLQYAVAEATRGPAGDLDRWPYHRIDVDEVTRLLVQLTGLPDWLCHDAVSQQLLPTTRRRTALCIIREFDARLTDQSLTAAASAKLARERGRRTA